LKTVELVTYIYVNTAIDHSGHVPNYYSPRDSSKAKRAFDSHDGMNDPTSFSPNTC
jgi:hypothetical protein